MIGKTDSVKVLFDQLRNIGWPRKTNAAKSDTPLTSAALWVDAIKTARQLLKATGSVPNAIAILKAIES